MNSDAESLLEFWLVMAGCILLSPPPTPRPTAFPVWLQSRRRGDPFVISANINFSPGPSDSEIIPKGTRRKCAVGSLSYLHQLIPMPNSVYIYHNQSRPTYGRIKEQKAFEPLVHVASIGETTSIS